jgi:hypothetical protein
MPSWCIPNPVQHQLDAIQSCRRSNPSVRFACCAWSTGPAISHLIQSTRLVGMDTHDSMQQVMHRGRASRLHRIFSILRCHGSKLTPPPCRPVPPSPPWPCLGFPLLRSSRFRVRSSASFAYPSPAQILVQAPLLLLFAFGHCKFSVMVLAVGG